MAQHTVSFYPDTYVNRTAIRLIDSGFENLKNDSTSSYAISPDKAMNVSAMGMLIFNSSSIKAKIPTNATITKATVRTVVKLSSSGTGHFYGKDQYYSYAIIDSPDAKDEEFARTFSGYGNNTFSDSWATFDWDMVVSNDLISKGLTVKLDFSHERFAVRKFYIATFKLTVTYTLPDYYLDLNGYLDGATSGNISGYGVADVYINSSRVAAGVTDFYTAYQAGSTYEIKNIVPTAGHNYNGVYSGSLTGTLNSNTSVYLNFTTAPTTVTVSFDSQGGTVFPSRELTIGGTYGTLPTPTKANYTFGGWYTNTSYTTKIESSSIVPSSNHTLYAKWQPIGINNIRLGGNAPSKIYIGSQEVKQVYIGSTLVYSIG